MWKTIRVILLGMLAVAAVTGCRDAASALGGSQLEARANADALFYSLATRFGPTESARGYDEARTKFARSALVPSRIYEDSALWTGFAEDLRVLEFAGRPGSSGYLIGIREAVGEPRRPGEYRRSTQLRGLAREQYEWTIRDELAVGRVTPDELGAALTALLRAAEGSDTRAARAAYEAALPRTTAALGRLFTLDSLGLAPAPGGGTLVTLVTTLHPSRIAGELPRLARYLERYAAPARFELDVRDLDDARWWTARRERGRTTLRLRVHDGRLAPLEGSPRRMPDELRARVAFATRIRVFNVGLSDLVGDVTLLRAPNEKAFAVRFRREPNWHLPPLAERFIRTPLRRPFEGNGAFTGFSARRSPGGTLLVRDYQITVQESAVVRWFGGLGRTAVSEFRQGAEQEYDRFLGEVFAALRADAAALIR